MIVDKDYIYYLQRQDNKLYRLNLENNKKETLSDEKIMKFCKDETWIFYTLKVEGDSHERFKGLYRMDLDGSNLLVLDSDVYLEEVGLGITEDWICFVPSNSSEFSRLNRMSKDGLTVEGYNK
jgi:hypothetical protein